MSKIFAHRGFAYMYAENSLESIKEALSIDYIDGVEIDIRMTKDRQFVLIHDPILNNVSNGDGLVNYYTLKELKKLKFHTNIIEYKMLYLKSLINKDGFKIRKRLRKIKKHKFQITTLDKVLEILNDKILLIEIKSDINNDFDYEKFIDLINKYKGKKIMIQSFNMNVIKQLKKLDKKLNLGILIADINKDTKLSFKTNFISIKNEELDNSILVNALYQNKIINVWTVDYYNKLKKLIKKIDGKINDVNIITNNPDLIYKYFRILNKK